MTGGDIISKVDSLEPNQYSTTQKLEWLSTLDGKIIDQVILTHEPDPAAFPHLHWPDPFDRDFRKWAEVPPPPPRPLYPIPTPQPGEEPEPPDDEEKPERKPPYHSPNDELLIKDPYGSEIYQHWLQAKIASENAEAVKFNQQKMLFDAAYKEWTDMYNRTHRPLGARGGNRFRF